MTATTEDGLWLITMVLVNHGNKEERTISRSPDKGIFSICQEDV